MNIVHAQVAVTEELGYVGTRLENVLASVRGHQPSGPVEPTGLKQAHCLLTQVEVTVKNLEYVKQKVSELETLLTSGDVVTHNKTSTPSVSMGGRY